MEQKNRFLIFGLVFILSMMSAFAVLNDAQDSWSFNDNSFPLLSDGTLGNTLTIVNNITRFLQSGSNYAYDFEGGNDYMIDSTSLSRARTDDFTVSFWVNVDTFGNTWLFSYPSDQQGDFQMRATAATTGTKIQLSVGTDAVGSFVTVDSGALSTGTWYHVCAPYSNTNFEFFLNGVSQGSNTYAGSGTAGDQLLIGANAYQGNPQTDTINGKIDQFMIYDRQLSSTECQNLYASGTVGYDPYAPTTNETNHTVEQTAEFEQLNPVVFKTNTPGTYTTIFAQTFNVTNDTSAYSSFTSEIQTDRNDQVTCRVLINGTNYDTSVTRSFTANQKGIIYSFSSNYSLNGGVDYLMQYQCLNSNSATNTNVSVTEGVIHLLVDEDGNEINNQYYSGQVTFNSTSFQPLFSSTFQVSNKTPDAGELERILVIEGDITYIYAATANQSLFAEVDGKNTTIFPRYGTAGSIGSGGGFYFTYNVSTNTTANLTIWGKSSSATGTANISFVMKEFLMHYNEGKQENLSGTSYDSRTYTTIKTLTVNNSNHNAGDLVVKASISAQSLAGNQNVSYRFKLGSEYSQNYTRTITNSGPGVIVLQHVFDNIGTGVKNVTLESNSSIGSVELVGGAVIGYISEQVGVFQEGFYINATDYNNNSVLPSVIAYLSTGLVVSSDINGQMFIPIAKDQTVNVTLVSTNYFNATQLSHSTNNNLTLQMHQAEVRFNAFEIITDNLVDPANFTINGSIYSSNQTAYLSEGNWSVVFSAPTYFDLSYDFEVLALENKTINVSPVSGSIINITARDYLNTTDITTFSITISNDTLNYEENLTTTVGFIQAPVLQGYNYTISINASNYAIQNASVFADESIENKTFYLFTENSFDFTIRDEVTKEIINTTNFTIQFVGSQSYTYYTSNGSIYVDLITPDNYEIRYFSNEIDNYKLRSNFVTVTSQSYQNITLYALDDTNNTLTTAAITFVVYDGNVDPVPNALVRINRYYPDTNGFEKIADRYTDSNGDAFIILESLDAFYQIIVIYDDEIKYNSLVDINSQEGIQFQTGTYEYPLFITLEPTLTDQLNIQDNIVTSLNLINATTYTGYFTFTADYAQTMTACLDIVYSANNTLQTSCITSNSIAIQVPINVSTQQQVTAYGRIITSGLDDYVIFEQKAYIFGKTDKFEDNAWSTDFKFFIGFLIILFIGLIAYKVPELALLLQIAVFYVATFEFALFSFTEATLGGIVSTIIIIIFLVSKRK